MKSKNTFSLYRKFLLSYIIILVFPMLILGTFVYESLLDNLENEQIKKNTDYLTQFKYSFDSNILGMQHIMRQIQSNPDLSRTRMNNDVLDSINAIETLKNYILANNSYGEVFIYYAGDRYIFSSTGTYTPSSFFSLVYKFSNWSEEQFLNDVSSVNFPALRPVDNVVVHGAAMERYFTYILPASYYTSEERGQIFFLIRESSLLGMLNDTFNNHGGNMIICDNQFNIITQLKDKPYIHTDYFLEIMKSIHNASRKLYLDGSCYYITKLTSDSTGLNYATIIPASQVTTPLLFMKSKVLYYFLAIMIIGSLIIYAIMHMNYNPIKQLKEFTEKSFEFIMPGSNNEIETIRGAVEHASNINKRLQNKVEDSKRALRELLLSDLLKGYYSDANDFNNKGKDLGISFSRNHYMVVILLLENTSSLNLLRKDELIHFIEAKIPADSEGYAKDSMDQNRIVLVLSVPDHGYDITFLTSLQRSLQGDWRLDSTIGVGTPYQQLNDTGKSYIEASTAIDYRLIKGKGSIILFNEIAQDKDYTDSYPLKEISQMEFSFMNGDMEKVTGALTCITANIKNNKVPLFIAKTIYFDIIKTIINTLAHISKQKADSKLNYPAIVSLLQFETVDELADSVSKMALDIGNYIQRQNEDNSTEKIKRFTHYLNENFNDPQFTIQKMAYEFNMSLSHLSHYFKDYTGENITDYVNRLRIETAKTLLISTGDNIQDISSKVGYINASSFIRKFRQITGTSPGKFREYVINNRI